MPGAVQRARALASLVSLLDQCAAAGANAAELDRALRESFAAGAPLPAFVTGYYEPELRARTSPDGRFRFPIYRPPPEASGRAAPLPTRGAIDAGALAGRGLELFWTDDAIELFFLHVQGAGRLRLDDGRVVRVGFAASNGQPYRAIGAVLVERGILRAPEATAPAIKQYLRAHPSDAVATMQENPRYVFFRVVDAAPGDGPPGSLGAPLVPFRSVAVDPAVTAPGTLGRLDVALPDGSPLVGLVVAMDTGAAIKGPGRIDVFLGSGDRAESTAGELRSHGEVRWLRPARPAEAGGSPVRCGADRTLDPARVLNPSAGSSAVRSRPEGGS